GRARRHPDHGRRRPDAAGAGRDSANAQRPVPHPGLLSAHRRDRIVGADTAGDHPGDAAHHHLREAGARDRQRRCRVHGAQEAGGVLLMADATQTPAGAGDPGSTGVIAPDIDSYLDVHARKGMLRFLTCGSVVDGKSTMIGRLLYESKLVFEDQLSALESDSRKVGTQGDELDFALLVDGLAAEREQGITIDVAYRFFTTDKRKFIVADTPGHEQYTRNMVTGAS